MNSHVVCFQCKQYGHYANNCPRRQQRGNPYQDQEPEGILGKRVKGDLSMKIEKHLFNNQLKHRDDEERLIKITGPSAKLKDLPFRPLDISSAIAELANSL